MTDHDQSVKTLVNDHLDSADKWSDRFRAGNVALAVIIAGLGAMVAAEPKFGEYTGMVLGVLTAVFGALNKAIDPGEAAQRHQTRKRALELIKVEVDRTDGTGPFSSNDLKRLIYRAKLDPTSVLEEVVARTAAAGG